MNVFICKYNILWYLLRTALVCLEGRNKNLADT